MHSWLFRKIQILGPFLLLQRKVEDNRNKVPIGVNVLRLKYLKVLCGGVCE